MARQSEIPGTERPVNKKVELAGELLITATKKKTAANSAHKKQEQHLLDVMKAEQVPEYTSEELGKTFRIEDHEKVKVEAWQAPKGEAEPAKRGPRAVKAEKDEGDLN